MPANLWLVLALHGFRLEDYEYRTHLKLLIFWPVDVCMVDLGQLKLVLKIFPNGHELRDSRISSAM